MNNGKIIWGLLLIILGILLGLSSFGLIDWAFLLYMLRFWPVLLIIIGISILAGKSPLSFWLVLLVIVATLITSFYLWDSSDYKNVGNNLSKSEESVLIAPDVEIANLELDFAAGKLNMDVNDDRALAILYGGFRSEPKIDHLTTGNKAEYKIIKQASGFYIHFLSDKSLMEWNISLPQNILWHLDLELGASKADLDFRDIDLKSLDLDMGAGDTTIRLGEREMDVELDIDVGASTVKIVVPDTMELDIKLDGGLISTNFDTLGLTQEGDHYFTEGVSSSSKLILRLEGGASNFELLRQPSDR